MKTRVTHLRPRERGKVRTFASTAQIPEGCFGIVGGVLFIVIDGTAVEVNVTEPE